MDESEERVRAGMLEYGPLFAFWGIWIILAIAGMYALELLEMRAWIGLDSGRLPRPGMDLYGGLGRQKDPDAANSELPAGRKVSRHGKRASPWSSSG